MNFTAVHEVCFGRSVKDEQVLLRFVLKMKSCARTLSSRRACVPLRRKVAAAQSFKDFLSLQDGFAAGT